MDIGPQALSCSSDLIGQHHLDCNQAPNGLQMDATASTKDAITLLYRTIPETKSLASTTSVPWNYTNLL